jgi:hypothetical protein
MGRKLDQVISIGFSVTLPDGRAGVVQQIKENVVTIVVGEEQIEVDLVTDNLERV